MNRKYLNEQIDELEARIKIDDELDPRTVVKILRVMVNSLWYEEQKSTEPVVESGWANAKGSK